MARIEFPEMPAHVSWSSFDTWRGCGKRFYLQKIAKVDQRPMWASLGGSAVHRATEDWDQAEWLRERLAEAPRSISGSEVDIPRTDDA